MFSAENSKRLSDFIKDSPNLGMVMMEKMMSKVNSLPSMNGFNSKNMSPITISLGNISLPNVKDSGDFARTIVSKLENAVLQANFNRR